MTTDKVRPIRKVRSGEMPSAEFFGDEPTSDVRSTGPSIATIGADELFAPLPPIDWTVEALGLTSGAASALVGFGFVGKTVVAQSLILASAAGSRLWNVYDVGEGRALHLDFEQGLRLTSERYQRLAKGAGLSRADLGDRLRVGIMPTVYLDSPLAPDVYARAFDGFRIAVVDSLRAAAPSADENSSDVRRHIDVLTRASELTGCMPLFLHHARKPNDETKGGAKMSIRGSSAIYDACASVFVLEGEKNKPTRVRHEKDRVRGVLMPDFGLQIEDVAVGSDPRAGLRVVHLEGEQLDSDQDEDDTRIRRHEQLLERIKAHLASNPDTPGVEALRARVGGRKPDCTDAVKELLARGDIVNTGSHQRPRFRLTGGVS